MTLQPQDGGGMLLQNTGNYLPWYTHPTCIFQGLHL